MDLSKFETLPDEILMIIFQYIPDIYSLFRTFFGLNQRLNKILLDKRSHLLTNFLYINKYDKNFHYYYNSLIFKTISRKILSMNTSINEHQLYQCFQSLLCFHIQQQYFQIKPQIELQIEQFKSIRQNLTYEQVIIVDKDLKQTFEDLRKRIDNSTLDKIESLVYRSGACLEYNEHEQAGFYFSEDFRDLLLSHIDSVRIIQIFKTLFISNPYLLKYPCYGGGYRFTIYEFLLYYYYHNCSNFVNRKSYQALIDLILFATHCQKILSNGENWIEKIILMVLDIFSKSRFISKLDIFIQTSQLVILKILLDEYRLFSTIEPYDEYLTDHFQYILNGFIRINRLDVILLIYRSYKPIRDFFNNQINLRNNVDMLTGSQIRRNLFAKLIHENPYEYWLINENVIFILLEKKERKLIEILLKSSSLCLINQLDQYGNNLLLYTCLRVFGCRYRIVELLIRMGCDPYKRNFQGKNFTDALKLKQNRRLVAKLIKRKSIKIDRRSGQIIFTISNSVKST